jgi:hypothetical protein
MKLRKLDELKAMWTELRLTRPVFESRTVHEGMIVGKVKMEDFFSKYLHFCSPIGIDSTVATYSSSINLTITGGYNKPT